MEKLSATIDIFALGHELADIRRKETSGVNTPEQQADWPARLWHWCLGYDPGAVRIARQAVAQLKPAVVVTGGSRGIGLAMARRFLQAGSHAVIIGRDAGELSDAVTDLKRTGTAEVVSIVCDITQARALEYIESEMQRAGFYIDVLVNNAGVGLAGPFLTHTTEEISRLLALNIESLTRLTRAALPDMVARQRGGILNVASLGACAPGPHQAVYYASKSYVLAFTEAIAAETPCPGVSISCILPGPVQTGFHQAMGADVSLYRRLIPSLTPQRVAQSAYHGFIRGQRVIVPGIVNDAMFLVLRLLPHPLTVPVVGWLLKRRQSLSAN